MRRICRASSRVIGEVRAGEVFGGYRGPGEAVEIMTGAPLPEGRRRRRHDRTCRADAAIAREDRSAAQIRRQLHASRDRGTGGRQQCSRAGSRIGFAEIALLAMVGRQCVSVFRQPRVAILPTGDEIVEAGETPLNFRSATRTRGRWPVRCGAPAGYPKFCRSPAIMTNRPRALIERGLDSDLLLLSGGVSAGKYDIVERVLADLGRDSFSTGC